ncbi:hypothetical protein EVAR_66760_1 [Eumeta japonica]|uniref:Uncharacterized protein n=1 Tax=Eumeta variegata TaxID=151549 RepID=A0A4C1Z8H2_EUMVA|nr:hypothetical protein EVAR_66760_1 [Eumeta japonica]
MKIEDVEERREGDEGHGPLTRTALAAAVGCMDSLISGRQARSVRSTPTRVTDACRLDLVGVHQRPTTGGRLRVRPVPRLPPALGHYLFTTRCTGSTPRQGLERKEEVEGHGSLTGTALAAAVRRVDSLISGRQARSVRSTPTRVTDACRLDPVGVHQRPTTGGRLRVQLELCLPPLVDHQPRPEPPSTAGACAMTARARVWVGDWAPARCQSMDPPDTDHCHLSRLPAAARGARLGVAQRDRTPAHQDRHVSRECEYNHRIHLRHKPLRTRPTPTNNAGRPARVCAAEHARRAPRFAPRPGPACALFVTTLYFCLSPGRTSSHQSRCRRILIY